MDNTAAQRFDSTKFSERKSFTKFGAIEPPCLLPSFSMDNTAAQRFDSTKFSERQPFRNFGAFEPPWITQQRSGSIAPNFLKKTLHKIWCYRTAHVCCQYSQWITQQRSGSIAANFLKETLQKIWCYRAAPVCCHQSSFAMDNTAAQQFDRSNFSERTRFRKFGAIEPPLFVAIICNG